MMKKEVFIPISIIISCCISFISIFLYIPRLWGNYLSVIPSLAFMKPVYLFWKNSQVIRAGSFVLVAATLAALSIFFLYPRLIHLIKRGNRWVFPLLLVILAATAWWITNQINIPMNPGLRRIEIIPLSDRVSLVELKIDGYPVNLNLLEKGEGWAEKNNKLIYSGEGNAPLAYTFKHKTNTPIQLIFLQGQGAGSVIVKVNGQERAEYVLTGEEGERLVEVVVEPWWKTVYDISIVSILVLMSLIMIVSILLLISIILNVLIPMLVSKRKLISIQSSNQRLGAIYYSIFFLFIIFIVQLLAVPEKYFYYTGIFIVVYNLARLIFMVFLLVMLCSFGKLLFKVLKVPLVVKEDLDLTILYFFIGGSALNIFMYLLGLVNGIYFWVVLIIFMPLVYLSYFDLVGWFRNIKQVLSPRMQALRTWISDLNMQIVSLSPVRLFYGLLIITAITEAVLLLFRGVIIPDIDSDVITHYLPYLQAVIHNHGVSPNTVWYQYYYSQGNGLFFLSILFTNKYGPQLVSYIYVLFSALILYSLIKRFSGSHLLRWFIISMFFLILWSSNESLSRLHFIEMSGLAFSMWVAIRLFDHKQEKGMLFPILCGVGVVGLFLFSPKNIIFLLPFFFVITVWFFLLKRTEGYKSTLIIFGMLMVSLICILGFNYLATGMFDDVPLRIMWSLSDQQKFSQWVSPYMMLYLLEGSNSAIGTIGLNSPPTLEWYLGAFHIDKMLFLPQPWNSYSWSLFASLIAASSVSVVIGYRTNKRSFFDKSILLFLSIIIIGTAILLPIFLKQRISLYRTYILIIFFMLLLLVSLWEMGSAIIFQQKTSNLILNILLFIGWTLLLFNTRNGIFPITPMHEQGQFVVSLQPQISRTTIYFSGRQSVADIVKTIGIDYSDYYQAHQFIGEDKRILSFFNYVWILPGRTIEREIDFAYKEWHLMVFGEPEEAKKAFQREGINYFLISNDPYKWHPIGALPLSPLFNPDNLPNNFDVIWKSDQGLTYLITWKGTNLKTFPWEKEFLETNKAKEFPTGLYERVRLYYQKYGTNYPVYPDNSLPPVQGFQ
jgi:hypothetical protein